MPGFRGTRRNPANGWSHQKARAAAFKRLPEWSVCARGYGQPSWKYAVDAAGRSLVHYDHNDTGTGYLGFSHRHCNERAGASKGPQIANRHRVTPTQWRRHSRHS